MAAISELTDAPQDDTTPFSMTLNDIFYGTLDSGVDIDWIGFNATAGYDYQFTMAPGLAPDGVDRSVVTLIDGSGTELDFNTASSGQASTLVMSDLATATYYIQAASFADNDLGDYNITIARDAGRTVDTQEAMTTAARYSGVLDYQGDVDWISVTLQAGRTYAFMTSGDGSASSMNLPDVVLRDASGGVIQQDQANATAGVQSQILYTPTVGGTYFLQVQSDNGVEYGNFIIDTFNETADSAATGRRIAVGATMNSSIDFIHDTEWFGADLMGGQGYTVIVSGRGATAITNGRIQIHDAAGDLITSSDSAASGEDEVMTFTASADATYFINVMENYPLNTGDFSVTLLEGAAVLGGSGNDTLTGTDAAEMLMGLAGHDLILGAGGDDTLMGGSGDDTLDGGAGGDVIDGGDGFDIVSYESATRSVRVDLQNDAFMYNDAVGDTFANVEAFQTGGTIDQLRGDAAGNEFHTGGLSDRLYGRAGADYLFGEAGADAFYGGLGDDTMTGGADAGRRDRYIYFNIAESGVGLGNRDVITDFVAGEDRIEISRFDADITQGFKQAFTFVANAAFSGTAGELRYGSEFGDTIVQADVDGDGIADFEIELTGAMVLGASDFLI